MTNQRKLSNFKCLSKNSQLQEDQQHFFVFSNKISGKSLSVRNFVLGYLCVNNSGYRVSLEKGKLYRVIPDVNAASHSYIRVIDESGEDYAYSAERFFFIDLPSTVEKALFPTSQEVAA